jgi:hypothetical protein
MTCSNPPFAGPPLPERHWGRTDLFTRGGRGVVLFQNSSRPEQASVLLSRQRRFFSWHPFEMPLARGAASASFILILLT